MAAYYVTYAVGDPTQYRRVFSTGKSLPDAVAGLWYQLRRPAGFRIVRIETESGRVLDREALWRMEKSTGLRAISRETPMTSQMTMTQLLDTSAYERRVFYVTRRAQGALEYVACWDRDEACPRHTLDVWRARACLWLEEAQRLRDRCGEGYAVVDENGEEVT